METPRDVSLWSRLASPLKRLIAVDDTFSPAEPSSTPLTIRIAIAVAVGLAAGVVSAVMTHPIRFQGEWVGDIGPPIVGARLFLDGVSPYALSLREGAITLYPFTTSVVLSPFLLIPPALWAPLFSGAITALFAFGIISHGRPWQLLALCSPCFMTAMHSVQWSPVLTASLMLPILLPLAVVKPQIGLVLAACGHWRPVLVAVAMTIVVVSVALLPTWPLAWITQGNLDLYAGTAPFTVIPGFLLLSSGFLWRKRRGRLLLLMSLVRQRYFYDQFLLFLVPKTAVQMVILVGTSWAGWLTAKRIHPNDLAAGVQYHDVWMLVVLTLYLPALAILWFNFHLDRRKARAESDDSGC